MMLKRAPVLSAVAVIAFAPALSVAQTKISGLPAGSAVSATDVFPATQGSCPSSCVTGGVTGAQLKTWAQSGLSASSLSNGTTGSGAVVLATSPSLTTPSLGVATVTTIAGAHALSSITAGATAQIGTGGTAVCATSHACTSLSGEITLTLGTGTLSAGTLFTMNFADTRTNIPNCLVQGQNTTAGAGLNSNQFTRAPTTTTLAVASDVVLTASQTLTFDYECGGN